jgi:hypothetical protein
MLISELRQDLLQRAQLTDHPVRDQLAFQFVEESAIATEIGIGFDERRVVLLV